MGQHQVFTVDQDRTADRDNQSYKMLEQRTFPAAAAADNNKYFPAPDTEVQVFMDNGIIIPGGKVFNLYDWCSVHRY
jgi:hypothetical protein